MDNRDGMNYALVGKSAPVVKPGEFTFAAVGLDHGHIYGMTNGLKEAGATLKWVYDPDPAKVEAYRRPHPEARAAESEAQVLDDPEVKLVVAACVPGDRAALGIRVMKSGKDYFTGAADFAGTTGRCQNRRARDETQIHGLLQRMAAIRKRRLRGAADRTGGRSGGFCKCSEWARTG